MYILSIRVISSHLIKENPPEKSPEVFRLYSHSEKSILHGKKINFVSRDTETLLRNKNEACIRPQKCVEYSKNKDFLKRIGEIIHI